MTNRWVAFNEEMPPEGMFVFLYGHDMNGGREIDVGYCEPHPDNEGQVLVRTALAGKWAMSAYAPSCAPAGLTHWSAIRDWPAEAPAEEA